MLTSTETEGLTQRAESIVRSLCARLGGDFDAAAISVEVEQGLAAYSTARVTQFVPALVESRVRARLAGNVAPRAADRPQEEQL